MKPTTILLTILALAFLVPVQQTQAQIFKKLGKKIEKAAERGVERTVERRTEKEASEKTDEAIDEVLEDKKKTRKQKREERKQSGHIGTKSTSTSTTPTSNSNFDFVAGDRVLVSEDFSKDRVGDFPATWDTNGTGEIVTLSNDSRKWLKMGNNSLYLPHQNALPEEYTVEFDMVALGLNAGRATSANVSLRFDEDSGFKKSANRSGVKLPFDLYTSSTIGIDKYQKGEGRVIHNRMDNDFRDALSDVFRVSIAVNKSRFRLWVNQDKIVDVPRLINSGKARFFKLEPSWFKEGTEEILITNLKIAAGGEDLRSKLINEGRFSTTGILFSSGSATIKPESKQVLQNITEALQGGDISVKIVGHTDSDGNEASNLELSKKRAESVRNYLISQGISASQLQTDGKGESSPLASNNTAQGKAQNRRVEFIKL